MTRYVVPVSWRIWTPKFGPPGPNPLVYMHSPGSNPWICRPFRRIGTKWLFFFTLIGECCVVIEKNIDKKLANKIIYQICYKRSLERKFGRGGPNLRRGVHIRSRIWTGEVQIRGGFKSAVIPAFQERNQG